MLECAKCETDSTTSTKYLSKYGTGFILKPGTAGKAGKWAIFAESQGKPGIVREFSIIFIQVKENKPFGPQIIFINSLHGCLQSGCSICCQ